MDINNGFYEEYLVDYSRPSWVFGPQRVFMGNFPKITLATVAKDINNGCHWTTRSVPILPRLTCGQNFRTIGRFRIFVGFDVCRPVDHEFRDPKVWFDKSILSPRPHYNALSMKKQNVSTFIKLVFTCDEFSTSTEKFDIIILWHSELKEKLARLLNSQSSKVSTFQFQDPRERILPETDWQTSKSCFWCY